MEQVLCLRGVNFKVQWELAVSDAPHHAEWQGKGPARSHAETEYRLADRSTAARASTTATSSGRRSGRSARSPAARWSAACPPSEADASLKRLKALVEKAA